MNFGRLVAHVRYPKIAWETTCAGLIMAGAILLGVSQTVSCHAPQGIGKTVRIGGIPVASDAAEDEELMCWDVKTSRPAKCVPSW